MGKNDKQKQLDQIKADILKDNVCPNLAQTATQLVTGDGNPDADIVFIGEAPGKNEDKQGLPFVGAAGKFLDEMLASIELKRSDVFITNIVKYRPPNNRDPEPEEKKAFFPYLEAQLSVIQPKLIATLGRHSMNVFLPDLKISQVHGKAFRKKFIQHKFQNGVGADEVRGEAENRSESYNEYEERDSQASTKQSAASSTGVSGSAGKQSVRPIVILPLYHPAAALYNGGMRQTLLDDFAKVPKILKLIQEENNNNL